MTYSAVNTPAAPAPPEHPPGGYFIMIGYEQTAAHCDTLSEARERGQKMCDEEPLPDSWSIHDEDGELVEDIVRSDGQTLADQAKAFGRPAARG